MALLTKSKYIQAFQCKKLFWLSLNDPKKISIDDSKQAIFNQGNDVGFNAQSLFPDGQLIENEISFMDKLNQTQRLIDLKSTIFEASFLFNKCYCQVDILFYKEGLWHMVEVKSSASLKPVHLHDVAFQYYVLSQSGLSLGSAYVYHIDTSYFREDDLDLDSLFKIHDITDSVIDLQANTRRNVMEYLSLLNAKDSNIPIGPQCFQPYECSAIHHCWQDVPEDSIFDLVGMPINEKFEFFYNNESRIDSINPDQVKQLNQKRQIACHHDQVDFLNIKKVSQFINQVHYPIGFLDFECVQYAIPPYAHMKPYEQLPVQFSLHIDSHLDLKHCSFIAPHGTDPRLLFIQELQSKLPTSGSILVYNINFESAVLLKIKALFPEYGQFIDQLISRFIDLEIPFKNQFIYLRDMKGKTSIKNVLPALFPGLNYKQIAISSGRHFGLIYEQLADKSQQDKAYLKLHEYGELDTYAMHLIFKKLVTLIT